jgi:hypothetical protein
MKQLRKIPFTTDRGDMPAIIAWLTATIIIKKSRVTKAFEKCSVAEENTDFGEQLCGG